MFTQWGMPQAFRCDNGQPWGSANDLPTPLCCWLVGLGIKIQFIPPGQPQKNGVVERSQGTGKRWAEPKQCDSVEMLQEHLDEVDALQREWYPYRDGQSRWEIYPQLRHSGRPYRKSQEPKHWEMARVWAYLSEGIYPRKVDRQGKVSLYDRPQWVGQAWAGKTVLVTMDASSGEWIFLDESNHEIRRRTFDEWTTPTLCNLGAERTKGRGRKK